MTDNIKIFFDAWALDDPVLRLEKIKQSVAESIRYDDPRTQNTVTGIQELSNYVGMFSANAPGWQAKVVKSDNIADITRVTVAFSGQGPDGVISTQLGQYFVEKHDDLISRMVGFVGTGD
jgi:hypothetical protein